VQTSTVTPCGPYIVQGDWRPSGQYFRSNGSGIVGVPFDLEHFHFISCHTSGNIARMISSLLGQSKMSTQRCKKIRGCTHALDTPRVPWCLCSCPRGLGLSMVTPCRHYAHNPRRLEIIWAIFFRSESSHNAQPLVCTGMNTR